MPTLTLYGIPNCDTVRKARAWLTEHGAEVQFHDLRRQGLPPQTLQAWVDSLGWESLLNRGGTTWRRLDEATRAAVTDASAAQALMLAQPSVIKRPVVQWPSEALTVGFSPERFAQHLNLTA